MSPLPSTGHSMMTFPQALKPELVPVVGAVPGPRAGGSPHPEPAGSLQLWPLSPWRCLPRWAWCRRGRREGGEGSAEPPRSFPGWTLGRQGAKGTAPGVRAVSAQEDEGSPGP